MGPDYSPPEGIPRGGESLVLWARCFARGSLSCCHRCQWAWAESCRHLEGRAASSQTSDEPVQRGSFRSPSYLYSPLTQLFTLVEGGIYVIFLACLFHGSLWLWRTSGGCVSSHLLLGLLRRLFAFRDERWVHLDCLAVSPTNRQTSVELQQQPTVDAPSSPCTTPLCQLRQLWCMCWSKMWAASSTGSYCMFFCNVTP